MRPKEELEDSAQQVLNMSFITSHLATMTALQTTSMMLHQSHRRQQEENERRRRQMLEEEEQAKKETLKIQEEEYIPKHAKKEDLEQEQVSF